MTTEKTEINPTVAAVCVAGIVIAIALGFVYADKSLAKKCENLKQAFDHYSQTYEDVPLEARDKMANELTEYMVPCAEKGIYWR